MCISIDLHVDKMHMAFYKNYTIIPVQMYAGNSKSVLTNLCYVDQCHLFQLIASDQELEQ